MTRAVIDKRWDPKTPGFTGALDSDEITLNGDVMRLFVFICPPLRDGDKERVTVKILELDRYLNEEGKSVDEGSADDTIAIFEGILQNKGGKFFFSEMKPGAEINWSKTAPNPWFRITFARESDKVGNRSDNDTNAETFPVVIGKNDEPQESPEFEIGFAIEKADGTVLGTSGFVVSYLHGEYSYQPFLVLFDAHTQLDSITLLNITNAQVKYAAGGEDANDELTRAAAVSTTRAYDATVTAYNQKKMKAVQAALAKVDKLIRTSRNPYFQNIQTVNDYYRKLEEYKGHIQQYQEMHGSELYGPSDCYTLEKAVIRPLAQELNDLERDVYDYLQMTGKPPQAYLDRIDKNVAIIAKNDKIEEILDNPAVQIMGLLPGAGVVTGTLKLIKGDYFDGFLDVFGAIVNYGSFLKLSRVARAYRKSSKVTVEMLYSYRYRKLVSSITSADVMENITTTSLKQSGTFLGNLFETVGTFKALRGHVDSIAILHRNRDYILDMTNKAISDISGGAIHNTNTYLSFLERLGNTEASLEFFAHLRLLHATVKGGRDTYGALQLAMSEAGQLLAHHEIPGATDFPNRVLEDTTTMFGMLNGLEVEMERVLTERTRAFPSTSAIVDYFNESLAEYDMFGVNRNADVRYRNTRMEMLSALDGIEKRWSMEKRERDDWIDANEHRYLHCHKQELRLQWARQNKSSLTVNMPETLESRIASFLEKLRGQIELREALEGITELPLLQAAVDTGCVPGTNFIFDFDAAFFCLHGGNLVKKYY